MKIILLIITAVLSAVVIIPCLLIQGITKTPHEQAQEDLEQLHYITKWKNKKHPS